MFTLRVYCVFCIVSGGAWPGRNDCAVAMINQGDQAPGKRRRRVGMGSGSRAVLLGQGTAERRLDAVSDKGDDKAKPKGRGKRPALSVVPGSVVVPLAKGSGKDANGLTAKQEAFCQGVGARGETLAAAYRAAYDTSGMAPATVHNEAFKLMTRQEIAARVNTLVREKQANASHDAARIRSHVIERLHSESINPDNPPAARVRALELLGKLDVVGAFRERVETEAKQAAPDDIAATLEARLKALLAKAG